MFASVLCVRSVLQASNQSILHKVLNQVLSTQHPATCACLVRYVSRREGLPIRYPSLVTLTTAYEWLILDWSGFGPGEVGRPHRRTRRDEGIGVSVAP